MGRKLCCKTALRTACIWLRTNGGDDAEVQQPPARALHHVKQIVGLQVPVHFLIAVQRREQPRHVLDHAQELPIATWLRGPRLERQAALEHDVRWKGVAGARVNDRLIVGVEERRQDGAQGRVAVEGELLMEL